MDSTGIWSVKQRRIFTAEEKARILAAYAYEATATPLERAALMCQEGVYSSLLSNWQDQLAKHAPPAKRGRPSNPLTADNARLRKDFERLERHLMKAQKDNLTRWEKRTRSCR